MKPQPSAYMLHSLKIRFYNIYFPKEIFPRVQEWWLNTVFAWATTRQEDNMAASEWEDASCLQPCPRGLSVTRGCPTLGYVLTLPLTKLKTENIPNRQEYFAFLKIPVRSFIFPLVHT